MPEWIFNPIMFEIGPIKAHWYGFMYAVSFILGYIYLQYSKTGKKLNLNSKEKDTLVAIVLLGVVLGGRIGYILFYNFEHFIQNPEKIIAVWEGGMSFHGGLIGSALGIGLYAKKKKIKLFEIGDAITLFAPLGIFLVKIANFINAELYGKIADKYCIYFPTDPSNCRYPSQLLEAFLEGIILFTILYIVARKNPKTGTISYFFLIFYGIFRIIAEFFREPDAHIGFLWGQLTEGQLLSTFMIIVGVSLLGINYKQSVK